MENAGERILESIHLCYCNRNVRCYEMEHGEMGCD